MLGIFLPDLSSLPPSDEFNNLQGRVTDRVLWSYSAPNLKASRVKLYWRDLVLPITNTTVVVGSIAKATFEDLLFMNKDLAYDLLWMFVRTLSSRLREANEKMRAFLTLAGKF